jgi:hypothetical protein
MAMRDPPLLSVPQFAAREGVSRIRVLQLLTARRIPGAHKIGHRWAIPSAAVLRRRARGRPRKAAAGAADRLLRAMARKYIWWLSPGEALARPGLVVTQVMEMGDYEDVRRVEAAVGRRALADALRQAEPGRLSARSWTYWHHRLGLARSGRIPPLPRRSFR